MVFETAIRPPLLVQLYLTNCLLTPKIANSGAVIFNALPAIINFYGSYRPTTVFTHSPTCQL